MKKLFLALIFFFTFLFLPLSVHANEDFDITANSTYKVSDLGNTTVTQKIKITNKKEYIYTPTYSVTLGFGKLENVKVFDTSGAIPFIIREKSDEQTIEVTFKEKVVGIGKSQEFTLSFDTDKIANQNGSIWELDIPGLSDPEDFSEYSSVLTVPESFGSASIIKPLNFTKTSSTTYSFSKSDLAHAGIFMLFGDVQYYKLNLDYHISNSNLFPIKTEIALPPSVGYQEISIQKINPPPKDVYQDEDGNWLAVYELLPQKKVTVDVVAVAKVSTLPKKTALTEEQKKLYTREQQYWNTSNAEIKKIAEDLKTPQNIYDYVVSSLEYNYEKVSDTNTRLGAVNVLNNPKNAVCLEFTDLFVALARAAGIPARAVEGYAFTENSKLRPLSLVKDVLHAWPEYYDAEQGSWIMVDPTWGNTTKGSDYFTTFDFDHIVFVINGKSSTYPIPAGGYKFSPDSKDVNVSFSNAEDFTQSTQAQITLTLPQFSLSGLPVTGYVTVKNIGTIAMSDKTITVNSDLTPATQTIPVGYIPPFGSKTLKVSFDKTPLVPENGLLTTSEYQVTILFDGNTVRKVVHVGLFTQQTLLVIGGGLFVACLIIFFFAFKTRRVSVQK